MSEPRRPEGRPQHAATLEQRWEQLGGPAATEDFVTAGRELIARYDEPWRGYHNRQHIAEALDALTALGGGLPEQVAIWFHDAVYGLGPGDDERASAELAVHVLRDLGMAASLVRQVERLVLVTEHHRPAPGDLPGARVSDADMAILASSPERYAQSVRGIRQEYAAFDDQQFAAGRVTVLESFLDLAAIYHTPYGREHWEAAARRNVRAELEQRRRELRTGPRDH